MALYDSSTIISCIKSEDPRSDNCQLIFEDDECIITPTVYKEVTKKKYGKDEVLKRELRESILEHCRVYTYDDEPFSSASVDVNAFTTEIYFEWFKNVNNRKGRSWFKFECKPSGNLEHIMNDYMIIKEANVYAEHIGREMDFFSGDKAQTKEDCWRVYAFEMRNLGEEPMLIPHYVKPHD